MIAEEDPLSPRRKRRDGDISVAYQVEACFGDPEIRSDWQRNRQKHDAVVEAQQAARIFGRGGDVTATRVVKVRRASFRVEEVVRKDPIENSESE